MKLETAAAPTFSWLACALQATAAIDALESDMNAVAPTVASPVGPSAAGKTGSVGNSSPEADSASTADFAALLTAQFPLSEEIAGLAAVSSSSLDEEEGLLTGDEPGTDTEAVAAFFGGPSENAFAVRQDAGLAFSMPVSPAATASRPDDTGFATAPESTGAIGGDETNRQLKDLASGLEALLGKKDQADQASEAAMADKTAMQEMVGTAPSHAAELGGKHQVSQVPAAINAPLHSTRWSDDFSQKLVWMAKNDLQSAQLSINPANLGPIEVTLSIGKDSASAHFASPFAEVREALESALPRLKEMLAESGVALSHADVGAQSQNRFADGQAQRGHSSPVREPSSFPVATAVIETLAPRVSLGIGMVDTFA
jgi:flagellar hook-length control protein FliK